jgi:Na+-translocating ferredoxin:NAD+ oxidoreductase subunit G
MSQVTAEIDHGTTWKIYAVVVAVGVACGTLVLTVHESTRRQISDNRVAFRNRAALAVLPGAERIAALQLDASGRLRLADDPQAAGELLAGFGADGMLVGVAIEASGSGYQDRIRLLWGYSPLEQTILGFRMLESRETPGLGDRVETDAAFVDQFRGLPVRAAADGSGLDPDLRFVGSGRSEQPWQIDGISGATVTSRAVTEAIAASARQWVPRIVSSHSEWTHAPP